MAKLIKLAIRLPFHFCLLGGR